MVRFAPTSRSALRLAPDKLTASLPSELLHLALITGQLPLTKMRPYTLKLPPR